MTWVIVIGILAIVFLFCGLEILSLMADFFGLLFFALAFCFQLFCRMITFVFKKKPKNGS